MGQNCCFDNELCKNRFGLEYLFQKLTIYCPNQQQALKHINQQIKCNQYYSILQKRSGILHQSIHKQQYIQFEYKQLNKTFSKLRGNDSLFYNLDLTQDQKIQVQYIRALLFYNCKFNQKVLSNVQTNNNIIKFAVQFKDRGKISVELLSQLEKNPLKELYIINSQLQTNQFKFLNSLKKLKILNLSNNHIQSESIKHLYQLTQIEILDLSSNDIRDSDIKYLFKMNRLFFLNLAWNKLSIQVIHFLVHFSKMKYLNLKANNIIDIHFSDDINNLRTINLIQTNNNMFNSKNNMTIMNFESNPSNFQCIKNMTEMRYFNLSYNQLTDEIINFMCELQNLQYLNLRNNKISDKGLQKLITLKKLRTLDIRNNSNITQKGLNIFINEKKQCFLIS